MRIAYLTSEYPAISHTFIRREVRELRSRGYDIRTFSVRAVENRDRLGPVDQEEAAGTWNILPTEPLRLGKAHLRALLKRPLNYLKTAGLALGHRAPGVRGGVWALFHFAEAIDLAAELERQAVEHLHTHFGNSGATVGLLASHFLDVPFSFTIHGNSEFDFPAGLLLADKIRAARFVSCVTHFGRSQAMRSVEPEHWSKMIIVRAGIEPPLHALEQSGHTLTVTPPQEGAPMKLVCVARLAPAKGHVGLIQAFAQVVREGIPVTLELLGGGPSQADVEAEIARFGLQDRVKLHGHVPEHEAFQAMANATAVVLASFIEGLPCVLMEALALGVPVVAPCLAGIPELVENGVSGLTFAPGDWSGLARALITMLRDPALRTRLAREGKERVEAEFFVSESVTPLTRAYGGEVPSSHQRHRPSATGVESRPLTGQLGVS
jgi:colanic acid/amylovoran biosynthesis glycosyltransferase